MQEIKKQTDRQTHFIYLNRKRKFIISLYKKNINRKLYSLANYESWG